MKPNRRRTLSPFSLPLALGLMLALVSATGCSTTLSAKAKGSKKPKTQTCTLGERVEVENGDFTIVQSCVDTENLVVGDGVAESTTWVFDLHDQDVAECFPEWATIEMRLRPTGDLMGEELRVQQRWAMGLEAIQSLDVGTEQALEVDMMIRNGRPSPYTPSEIRHLILDQYGGTLPMVYELNALVSYAELTIDCRR
jgi:hypothetical protein